MLHANEEFEQWMRTCGVETTQVRYSAEALYQYRNLQTLLTQAPFYRLYTLC